MTQDKSTVRRDFLRRRNELTPKVRAAANKQIVQVLLRLDLIQKADSVGMYSATGSEVDPSSLFPELRRMGKQGSFPKVRTSENTIEMDYYSVDNTRSLTAGFKGILEPPGTGDITYPTALIVPGVAFARDFSRMGYGGGTYDRYITNRSPRPLLIGVTYADTMADTLPMEGHDWSMDVLVTEHGPTLKR